MINNEAYKIVEAFVKEHKGKYRTGKDCGLDCYYSNKRVRDLIAESTACSYACAVMKELNIGLHHAYASRARVDRNLNNDKVAYSEAELVEKLSGIEYLGRGMYKSIHNNNTVY